MLEEIGLVFGVVSFIVDVTLLYRASNADVARVLSAGFASFGAHLSHRKVQDGTEAPLQSLPRALATSVFRYLIHPMLSESGPAKALANYGIEKRRNTNATH